MIYSEDNETEGRYSKLIIVITVVVFIALILTAGWFVYKELFRANDPAQVSIITKPKIIWKATLKALKAN